MKNNIIGHMFDGAALSPLCMLAGWISMTLDSFSTGLSALVQVSEFLQFSQIFWRFPTYSNYSYSIIMYYSYMGDIPMNIFLY